MRVVRVMANTSSTGSNKVPVVQGFKKPPIISTSWSFTDNEPDTKYDHAWSIANFSRKVTIYTRSLWSELSQQVYVTENFP